MQNTIAFVWWKNIFLSTTPKHRNHRNKKPSTPTTETVTGAATKTTMAAAAVPSTTTTTVHIRRSNFPSPTAKTTAISFNPITSLPKPLKFIIRNSNELSAETATTETTTELEAESSLEASDESPSLISALNVERALRGIPITDVNHYGRLGLRRGCPYDQVPIAYNIKVEELKSQGLEEEELNQKLELLKESYTILSSVEERRMYDWSLARIGEPDKYSWPFEADITQIQTQLPPPKEPEDEGPTKLVGYFFLGWFVLSAVLSIALNL